MRHTHSAVLLSAAVGAVALVAGPLTPIASFPLDQVFPGAKDSSAVFLTNENIALLLRSTSTTAKAVVLQLAVGGLRITAETSAVGDQLFSVAGGKPLIAERRRKVLYSRDLRQTWEMAMGPLSRQFPETAVIGEGGLKGHKTFRLTTPPTPIQRGPGELLATADDLLLYQSEGHIRTATIQGAILGTVPIEPGHRYFNNVEFAGHDRLYFSAPGDERVTDLDGRAIGRIHPPEGWAFRHGWNSDGSRLLFDRYVHRSSIARRVLGAVVDAAGSTLPADANTEIVEVMDVSTGGVCFNLEMSDGLFGFAGGYHADLSPSGELVAVATPKTLDVYRLPPTCPKE